MFVGGRRNEIYRQHQEAALVQEEQLQHLVHQGEKTKWGQERGYSHNMTYREFCAATPLSSYEDFFPWIERALNGEQDVLWPGEINKFAKSSGTTNARSKYIPITDESLSRMHYRGGKDMWIFYLASFRDAGVHFGQTVGIGGSLDEPPRPGVQVGDLSAIIMNNLPKWAQNRRSPGLGVATMANWDEKLEVMAEELRSENVRALAGVPTWTLLLIKKMMEKEGVDNIYDLWPKLEVFFHGAVAFDPYRQVFRELLGEKMRFLELYNASEGFFGIQDDQSRPNEMLLMLDYGVFYEFLPLGGEVSEIVTIGDVEVGRPYEIIITTNCGLWRYRLGDVIEFTSIAPYRVRIGGRTKHFINAFGEELMVANADEAVTAACLATGAAVAEYTAGPQYMDGDKAQGRHEWVFEFSREPADLQVFVKALDNKLREVNSDYDAKRKGNLALLEPEIKIVPIGTFRKFLENRGEINGRNKVPRLANHRDFLEKILTNAI